MNQSELESDKKLDELYQQLPRPTVPESVRANLFALAQAQAQENEKSHQQQRKGGFSQWFQNMFLGAPVYAWSGMAMCVLAVGVVLMPSQNTNNTTNDTFFMASKDLQIKQSVGTAEPIESLPSGNPSEWEVAKVEPANTKQSTSSNPQNATNADQSIEAELHMSSVNKRESVDNDAEIEQKDSKSNQQEDINRQITKIRILNQLNDAKAAKQALFEFEKKYPNYDLPQDIKALKATQP